MNDFALIFDILKLEHEAALFLGTIELNINRSSLLLPFMHVSGSFDRPILQYFCVLFDNCRSIQIDMHGEVEADTRQLHLHRYTDVVAFHLGEGKHISPFSLAHSDGAISFEYYSLAIQKK